MPKPSIEAVEDAVIVRAAGIGQAVNLSIGVQQRLRVWSGAVRDVEAVDHGERAAIRLDLEDGAAQRGSST